MHGLTKSNIVGQQTASHATLFELDHGINTSRLVSIQYNAWGEARHLRDTVIGNAESLAGSDMVLALIRLVVRPMVVCMVFGYLLRGYRLYLG